MSPADVEALLDAQRRSYASAGGGLLRSWPQGEAMDAGNLREFLERLVYGVLATSRPDGRAHAAPVAFSVEDGSIWVATVAGVRLRNLRVNPWASLVVFEGQRGASHRALTVEGPVRLHEGADFADVRARLDGRWSARHEQPPNWAVAFLELEPERVFSHRSRRA